MGDGAGSILDAAGRPVTGHLITAKAAALYGQLIATNAAMLCRPAYCQQRIARFGGYPYVKMKTGRNNSDTE